jgi:hypothetical protein
MVLTTDEFDGSIVIDLDPPTIGEFRPTVLMQRVSEAIEGTDGLTQRKVLELVRGKKDSTVLAIKILIEEGFVTFTDGPRGSLLYHSKTPFRPRPEAGRGGVEEDA